MNRKQILGFMIVIISATLAGLAAIAISPVWLMVLMVKPSLVNPIAEKVTGTISANVMRSMIKNSMNKMRVA